MADTCLMGITKQIFFYYFDVQISAACQECSLHNRGPDAQGKCDVQLNETLSGVFCGTTLHFRGNLTLQPLKDDEGNVLLWNGEVFGGIQVIQ